MAIKNTNDPIWVDDTFVTHKFVSRSGGLLTAIYIGLGEA